MASSLAVTLSGVTAGNALIVGLMQDSTVLTTYSASDDVDGALTKQVENDANSGRYVAIFTQDDCTGGDTQVTVTLGASETVCNRGDGGVGRSCLVSGRH